MRCLKVLPASSGRPRYETNTVTFCVAAAAWPREPLSMNAAALVFRFRMALFVLLYVLGFLPPWDWRAAGRGTLWLSASTWLAKSGSIGLENATLGVTVAALLCLVIGALLRVWGTAYLGSGVMGGSSMQGDTIVAGGPYRYLRNPLYLGSCLLALGVSILMPPSGALFFLLALGGLVLCLIFAEERFLRVRSGDMYRHYCRAVPRLFPFRGAGKVASAGRPRWVQALLAEIYPVAVTLCFAVFAWRFNAEILIRCVLISYGASLVVRALAGGRMIGTRVDPV